MLTSNKKKYINKDKRKSEGQSSSNGTKLSIETEDLSPMNIIIKLNIRKKLNAKPTTTTTESSKTRRRKEQRMKKNNIRKKKNRLSGTVKRKRITYTYVYIKMYSIHSQFHNFNISLILDKSWRVLDMFHAYKLIPNVVNSLFTVHSPSTIASFHLILNRIGQLKAFYMFLFHSFVLCRRNESKRRRKKKSFQFLAVMSIGCNFVCDVRKRIECIVAINN